MYGNLKPTLALRHLLNFSISPQSLTPWKGEGGVRAQRRHGSEHVSRPDTHGQLHCDNTHSRSFDVTPTSYHSAFCIILRKGETSGFKALKSLGLIRSPHRDHEDRQVRIPGTL